jgi:DNA ligase-1
MVIREQESLTYYKKRATGKIQEWSIRVFENNKGIFYQTKHGQTDGKIQESELTEIKCGKNIGKKNETTPYDQALKEMQSKINKKIKEGFVTNQKNVNKVIIKAQKYKTFADSGKHLKYPVYAQYKSDGFNVIAYLTSTNNKLSIELRSRQGDPIYYLDHIRDELINSKLFKDLDENNLDDGSFYINGELYKHGWRLQKIASLASKKPVSKLTELEKKEMNELEFHIFDSFSLEDLDDGYSERYEMLEERFKLYKKHKFVTLVPNHEVNNEAEAYKLLEYYTSLGYEGVMLKNKDSKYRVDKRISDIVKLKPYNDSEFEIVGFRSGKGKFKDSIIFEVITEDGKEFRTTMKGTAEERKNLLDIGESLIGKWLTVKYFELSKDGIPTQPVALAIREKNKA